MTEPKHKKKKALHTLGVAESLEGPWDDRGMNTFIISSTPQNDAYTHREIATVKGFDDNTNEANAARLVQGWNLLNRLDEMGVSAEQVPEIIEALRMVEKRGCGKPLSIVQMLKVSDALAKKA